MSVGLIGLLDDIAAIAKVAAASLDDVASQAAKAGAKAAGVVIDDTAVTPGYVIGFEPEARACRSSARSRAARCANKLLILLPAALVLSYFAALGDHAAADAGRRLSLLRRGGEGATKSVMPHRRASAHEAKLEHRGA